MFSLSVNPSALLIWLVAAPGCAYLLWSARRTTASRESEKAALLAADRCVSNFGQIPVNSDTSIPETAWPTKLHPAQAHSIQSIVNANAKLIRDICFASKLTEDEYMQYLVPVIFNLARHVHVCPASEYDHHQGYGGLFTHSLEVAYYAANKGAGTIFDRNATPQDRHNNRRRWMLVCILAGLLHDCGKPYTDMNITAADGRLWKKDAPLLTWLRSGDIREYFVAFRVGRVHNEHMAKSLAIYKEIIPEATLRFLCATPTGQTMVAQLEDSLLNGKQGGLIGSIVVEADGLSRELDMLRQRQVNPAYKNVAHPQGDMILKAIRALISSAQWTVNADADSEVFNTRQGCFIQWKDSFGEQISRQAGIMGYEGIPTDAGAIARILVDAQAAQTFLTREGRTPSLYKSIHPIFMENGQLACIKIRDEKFIFDAVPPSIIECIEEGVPPDEELKAAWKKAWNRDPTPIRSPDDDEYGFDETFVEGEQIVAREHREEARTMSEAEREYFSTGTIAPPMLFEPQEQEEPAGPEEQSRESASRGFVRDESRPLSEQLAASAFEAIDARQEARSARGPKKHRPARVPRTEASFLKVAGTASLGDAAGQKTQEEPSDEPVPQDSVQAEPDRPVLASGLDRDSVLTLMTGQESAQESTGQGEPPVNPESDPDAAQMPESVPPAPLAVDDVYLMNVGAIEGDPPEDAPDGDAPAPAEAGEEEPEQEKEDAPGTPSLEMEEEKAVQDDSADAGEQPEPAGEEPRDAGEEFVLPEGFNGPKRLSKPQIAAVRFEQKLLAQMLQGRGDLLSDGVFTDDGVRWTSLEGLSFEIDRAGTTESAVEAAAGWHEPPMLRFDVRAGKVCLQC